TLRLPRAAGGREIVAGVRPEDLEVGSGQPLPEGAVSGRVYVVEPMGAETWVTVEISGQRVVGRAPGDFRARSGQEVWVRCDRERVLSFDARTGHRIEI